MMQAIVNAIVAGLKAIGGVLRGGLALPGRLIHTILGGGGPSSDIPSPPPVSIDAPVEHADVGREIAEQFAKAHEANAAMVRAWAASSLSAGAYQAIPPKLPRDVRKWLPGLKVSELLAIINATPAGVSEHLRSKDLISSVRSVRPLESSGWHDDTLQEPALPPDYVMPSFLSVLSSHETGRFQALREAAGFRVPAF